MKPALRRPTAKKGRIPTFDVGPRSPPIDSNVVRELLDDEGLPA